MRIIILTMGVLMLIGLAIGVIFTIVFIFAPEVIYFKILLSGWFTYFITSVFLPSDFDNID